MRSILMAIVLLCGSVGCARYEYNITEPPDLAQHIGRQPVALRRGPLAYHLQSYENRLVLRVENVTARPVQVLGDRSWIVTPEGESRPLGSQAIAPSAHVKLVLPPLARRVVRSGPSLGFGFGIGSGGRVGTGIGIGAPLGGGGYVYDEDERWDWPAGRTVRLHLVGEHDGAEFSHDFTIDRQRM